MSKTKERPFSKSIQLTAKYFFRNYPALPFIVKWLPLTLLLGIMTGTASAVFLLSLDWATNYRESNPWIIALLPVAGLLIGLLYHYKGREVDAGNNLLLETVNHNGPVISWKMAPFIYISTVITHLFGGSAGREGTALQMAGSLADQLSKPFKLTASDRQVLIISAIAGGFGSVFGTPLAGAVFALEVFLTGRLKYEAIFPAFSCAIFADLVTTWWNVHHTHYQVDAISVLSLANAGYAILAGVFFGLCAAAFSKGMKLAGNVFRHISYAPLRPVAGGMVIACAVWASGTTKYIGLGIPGIVSSFDQQQLPYDFALKMIFTIITLGAGFKGGEVTPLFFIGALLGNALSFFLPLPVSLLAGMGFVAVFAGATNTPLACSLMAMELFGAGCGIYAALACVTAYLLSGNNSIYGKQLVGVPKHARNASHEGRYLNDL